MARFSLLSSLAVLVAVFIQHRSSCQSMSTGDTIILIKPEEMRIFPKSVFEKFDLEQLGTLLRPEQLLTAERMAVAAERMALPTAEMWMREQEARERKPEEEEEEEEEKKPEKPDIFKTYVAIGEIKLIFDNTTEPFTLFYDGENNRSRVDLGVKGLVRSLQLSNLNRMYRIEFPSAETPSERAVCIEVKGTEEKPVKAIKGVPDLDRFERVGEDKLGEVKVEKWKMDVKDAKFPTEFLLFTEPETEKPIRLEVFSRSAKSNMVVDHYQINYKYFLPTQLGNDVFLKPSEPECRSITGLTEIEETKMTEETNKTSEERQPARLEVDNERLHMNPIASLIDPDQRMIYERELDKLFEGFRRRFDRRYKSDDEYELRRVAFSHNYRYINLINRAGLPYRLKINHLADRTNDEFRTMLGVYGVGEMTASHGVAFDPNVHNVRGIDRLPRSIDWRLLGALTPVTEQGECGSDWAISATSVIESALYLRSNRLVKLSPQELLDCGHETGNQDCKSGTPWQAYEYVLKNGISSEIAYGPYSQRKNECNRDAPVSAKIRRWVLVGNDEHELKKAIAMNGPVAVTMDAAHKSFFFYGNGVYNEPNCRSKPSEVNHAVTVVGYGELNGRDYFLVQNSFSDRWGLNGYMLIDAKENTCGILSSPTFVDM